MAAIDLKLIRAREHLESFKVRANAWIEGNPYVVVEEPNPNPPLENTVDWLVRHRRYRLDSIQPIPDELGLIIGECVVAMRSQLDHLAFALANRFTPNMTDAQTKGCMFPVSDGSPLAPARKQQNIGCIDPAAQIVIEALQPCHRGQNYRTHPLWQVNELNNIDKHRIPLTCTYIPVAIDSNGEAMKAIGITVPENFKLIARSMHYYRGSGNMELIPNTVFAEFGLLLGANPQQDVYLQPHLPLEIAFGKCGSTEGLFVIPTLEAALDFIRDSVVAQLAKFL